MQVIVPEKQHFRLIRGNVTTGMQLRCTACRCNTCKCSVCGACVCRCVRGRRINELTARN